MASFTTKGASFTLILTLCIATAYLNILSSAEPTADKQALIDFITRIGYRGGRVKWNSSTSACNWTGVVCDSTQTHVIELRLPGVGLTGQIPDQTIGRLTQLRVLSLRMNRLSGSIPADLSNLSSLQSLNLKNNRISGGLPASLTRLKGLSRIDVSSNRFEGRIPDSIGALPLENLFLQNNRFSGSIPPFMNSSDLIGFDVSNNNLSGEIPATLSKFPEASFSGNLNLCGKPLPLCDDGAPSPSPFPLPPPRSGKLTRGHIAAIVVSVIVALILLSLLLLCYFKHSGGGDAAEEAAALRGDVSNKKHELVFFERENNHKFGLEDLLKASAEVLGKGNTGTSYKAEMDDGTALAVKRLKEVVVGNIEFETLMAFLGGLGHQNVLRLIAYYCSKDEKLLVSDYVPSGSLSSLLHGSSGSNGVPLDWITRFRIGLTAARGLHYIHTAARRPHGNVKSSNILITKRLEACISDYCMHSLFGPSEMTGYCAPEVWQDGKMVSFKSDVYSFGVVLLEMVTGKGPRDEIDLPRWVRSVEVKAEVLDELVVGNGVEEEEMAAVLEVGLRCVEVAPERRPEMGEVVRMLEMVESGEFYSPTKR